MIHFVWELQVTRNFVVSTGILYNFTTSPFFLIFIVCNLQLYTVVIAMSDKSVWFGI